MPMSSDQLTSARQFLADQGTPPAFTDDELNANYDLASQNFFMGLYYGVIQLVMNSSKMVTYTQGQTSIQRGQTAQNLITMQEKFYQLAMSSAQVQTAGMMPVPPRLRAEPWVQGSVSSVNYQPWRGIARGWNRGGW